MLKKIYFGDKILFLSDEKADVPEAFLKDKNTVIIKTLEKNELKSTIAKMQQASTSACIILHKMPEAFDTVKKEFTLIQASGGLIYYGNRILMIFRRGKWDLPKGKLDEGEDLVRCALREINEETGLGDLIFEQTLITTYHTYFEGGKHILKESHWHLIKGNDTEKTVPQTDEDIEKCEWIDIQNLRSYLQNAPASIIDVITQGLKVLDEKKEFD